ncbi:acyl-CoA thioesterase [Deefgea salmonis]|uniref:Acyl-CoA thioesterase n=1 Tax=Deefgea salmonis TaxID=2875502 RepID=A0ABS8BLZ2_9NEIS|nr:acyl-CoA thioesterase [Deefgea salmonis]MCB5196642.1 acyl-CoA thioesterase [Deefgea salmonis]
MAHLTPIKVHGFHLDLYGHVNNARYLEFLEEARWGLMEEYGDLSWFMAQKMALVVSRVDIRYIRAATMGDQLLIETRLVELLPREGKIHQRIVRKDNGKVVAEADISFAVIHPEQRGALLIEGELFERFNQVLIATSESE